MPLEPISTGDMESCPSQMGSKLKDIIPIIEKVLKERDGDYPYAVYRFNDIRAALGSSAKNNGGFVACINRLLGDMYGDEAPVFAHSYGENVMFNRVRQRAHP